MPLGGLTPGSPEAAPATVRHAGKAARLAMPRQQATYLDARPRIRAVTDCPEAADVASRRLPGELDRAEADAFEAELSPVLLPARRLAMGLLLDATQAEDAVQEAALRAWDRRRNRRPGSDLAPWFLGIVVNRCREGRRSRWARVLRLPDLRVTAIAAAPADADWRIDVRRVLRSLPSRARLALVLRYYLDLPYPEVAAVLGCSENAARVRVSRATAAMRVALGDAIEVRP